MSLYYPHNNSDIPRRELGKARAAADFFLCAECEDMGIRKVWCPENGFDFVECEFCLGGAA